MFQQMLLMVVNHGFPLHGFLFRGAATVSNFWILQQQATMIKKPATNHICDRSKKIWATRNQEQQKYLTRALVVSRK